MRPSRSQFWIRAMRSCVSTRQSFSLNRSRAARLGEDDEADERDEDEHDDAEAPLLRELQKLVLDETREPHTVSPPVISRKTSSSVEDGRSTVKTSIPCREKRSKRFGHAVRRNAGRHDAVRDSVAVASDARRTGRGFDRAECRERLRGPRRGARAHAHAIRGRAGGELAHRARGERPPAVDDRHAVARLLDLGEQVARDEDARSRARPRAGGRAAGSRGSRPDRGRSPARRGSARPARRAGPARSRAAAACRASRSRPCRPGARRARPSPPAPSIRPLAPGGQHPREVLEVLPSRQVAVEIRRLDDRAHVRHGLREVASEVEAADAHAAPVGPGEAHEHADRGRLAGSVRAQETEDLAGADVEGHIRDRFAVAEPLREVLGGEDDLGGRHPVQRIIGARMARASSKSSRFWLWTFPLVAGTAAALVLAAGFVLALRGAIGEPIGEAPPPPVQPKPQPARNGERRILVLGDSLARGNRRRVREGIRRGRAGGVPRSAGRPSSRTWAWAARSLPTCARSRNRTRCAPAPPRRT